MKLDKVEITYFRCFESLTIPLQPDVNVFVGVNGSGKTAILDAIAIALWDIVAANGGGGKRQRNWQGVALRPSDIHVPPDSLDSVSGRPDFVQIGASANEFYEVPGFPSKTPEGNKVFIEWQDYIQFRPPRGFDYESSLSNQLTDIYGYFEILWRQIETSDAKALIPLPVVAYYRAYRRLSEMPSLGDVFSLDLDRAGAFQGALSAGANYESMCQWFYLRENQELREKLQIRADKEFELADLKAVRQALTRTLENVEKVFFSDNPPSLKIAMREPRGTPKVLELEQLSDGYRNLLAVVLDFARRLAQANPGWENPLEAPGILMIDEIELHLHPLWQQTIIPNLRTVFPNTQIIATTHSPHVVTTVESKGIHIVSVGAVRPCPAPTYGARSSDVIAEVLGVPNQRPPGNEIANKIALLFKAIDSKEIDEAKRLRAELETWAKGYPEPDLTRAAILIRRLDSLLKNKGNPTS